MVNFCFIGTYQDIYQPQIQPYQSKYLSDEIEYVAAFLPDEDADMDKQQVVSETPPTGQQGLYIDMVRFNFIENYQDVYSDSSGAYQDKYVLNEVAYTPKYDCCD